MSMFEEDLKKKKEKLLEEMAILEDEIATRRDEYENMEIELKELNACLEAINNLWLR